MPQNSIQFTAGPFVGKTVRVELTEMQKPEVNRKTSTPMADNSVERIERRPLDPPPVIRLRLFEIEYEGTTHERVTEIDASSSFAYSGFACHVDLFPIREPPGWRGPKPVKQWTDGSVITWSPPVSPLDSPAELIEYDFETHTSPETEEALERKKSTRKLFGCKVVNAFQIRDLENCPCVVFTFGDISVRNEGFFVLRYRCFDIFSRNSATQQIPICAETWSSPFVVVGTKEFPGLKKSTELTRHLSQYGIIVNWRGMGRSQAQIKAAAEEARREAERDSEERRRSSSSGGRSAVIPNSPNQPYSGQPPAFQVYRPEMGYQQPPPQYHTRAPPAFRERPEHGLPNITGFHPQQPPSYPVYAAPGPATRPHSRRDLRPTFPSLTEQFPEDEAQQQPPPRLPPLPQHFGPSPYPPSSARHTPMPPSRAPYDRWARGDPRDLGQRGGMQPPERRF